MNRKKELKQQYGEIKIEAGVYQIKNIRNEKIFIGSTRNLKSLKGKEFELEGGQSTNRLLQAEWNEFGRESFVFDVLEILKEKEGFFDLKRELKNLENKWIEQLQPFGEHGYNKITLS